jgi:hypothetical protein
MSIRNRRSLGTLKFNSRADFFPEKKITGNYLRMISNDPSQNCKNKKFNVVFVRSDGYAYQVIVFMNSMNPEMYTYWSREIIYSGMRRKTSTRYTQIQK